MAEVLLINSTSIALIDDEDMTRVNNFRWRLNKDGYVHSTSTPIHLVSLHRFVMNAPPGVKIDHCEHNLLDCRKQNLRFATGRQNNGNSRKLTSYAGKPPTSKYKGVTWNKRRQRWVVAIETLNGSLYLGRYDEEIEAAKAYNNAAVLHFGEFAFLNQI